MKLSFLVGFACAMSFTPLCLQAAEIYADRQLSINASGACQSALPVFDVNIRKRPRAVQNEGTASAFVTCSFLQIRSQGTTKLHSAYVALANHSTQAVNIPCTGVNGRGGLNPVYVSKYVSVPPLSEAPVHFQPADFGTEVGRLPNPHFNISCQLPPETGITRADISYGEYIGEA